MGFKWPKGMKEVHYLDRLEGKKAIFKDGTEQDADVVILSPVNYNLLRLATEHDIKINSACKTGLCGACTASMADPNWVDGEADGVQTIRTCSANVAVPFGME